MPVDDLPCPECDGWMRLDGKRWACPSCGQRSEEMAEEEQEAVAAVPTATELAVRQGVATSSPSYAKPAGRPRSFGACLLLGIVTLGLYFLYWQWRVFREVHDQEGEDGHGALFGAAIGVAALSVILDATLDEESMAPDVVNLGASLLAFLYLLLETRALDGALARRGLRKTGAFALLVVLPPPLVLFALRHGGTAAIAVGILSLGVQLAAFWLLQEGLNRYWDAVRAQPAAPVPTALTPVAS